MYRRAEGELLHPVRESLAELNQLRADLGSRRFEAQYQQQPTPPDGAIFKRSWLRYYDGPYIKQPGDRVIQSWDMAAKPGDSNDCSVCITAVVRRSQVIVIDVFKGRLSFPDLKKRVIALAREYKPYRLLIEDASAGIQMIQTLQTEQPSGVTLPIAIKADKDKVTRADRAAARVENGSLLLPAQAHWLDSLVNEMMAFPAGRHDDQVDALSQLLIYTEAGGTVRFAPEALNQNTEGPPDLMHEVISRLGLGRDWTSAPTGANARSMTRTSTHPPASDRRRAPGPRPRAHRHHLLPRQGSAGRRDRRLEPGPRPGCRRHRRLGRGSGPDPGRGPRVEGAEGRRPGSRGAAPSDGLASRADPRRVGSGRRVRGGLGR